jgi:hypothetical protein
MSVEREILFVWSLHQSPTHVANSSHYCNITVACHPTMGQKQVRTLEHFELRLCSKSPQFIEKTHRPKKNFLGKGKYISNMTYQYLEYLTKTCTTFGATFAFEAQNCQNILLVHSQQIKTCASLYHLKTFMQHLHLRFKIVMNAHCFIVSPHASVWPYCWRLRFLAHSGAWSIASHMRGREEKSEEAEGTKEEQHGSMMGWLVGEGEQY